MRAHVDLAEDIPAPMYAEACNRLAKTWTYPSTPNPGDIRREAYRVSVELRKWERACVQQERKLALERGAMSVSEARAELERLASAPPIKGAWESIAIDLYTSAIRGIIARDERRQIAPGKLKVLDGGDAA